VHGTAYLDFGGASPTLVSCISVGYNLIVLSRDAASHSWLSLLLIIGWFSYMPLCLAISSPAISCFIFFISSGPVL